MTSVLDLLERLNSQGISLRLDNGDLRYSALKGAMTDEVRDSIRERREEIIDHLQTSQIGVDTRAAIPPLPTAQHYALSHAQQRIWVLTQMEDSSAAYNIPLNILLEGDLDVALLDQALQTVIERHESLRTTFSVMEGEPRQIVHPYTPCLIEVLDLSTRQSPDLDANVIAAEEAVTAFDLAEGPLLRMRLLRIDRRKHLLLCTMHHIISDGVSIGNFFSELTSVYNASKEGAPAPLVDLPIQYRDYASWQRQHLETDTEGHREYWRRQLGGNLPVLDLPADRHRPPTQTFNGGEIQFSLGIDRSEGIRHLAKENQSSLFMALLTCFKALLHRYTGAEDIIVGSPVAGRDHPDLQRQIGLYLNTIPLRAPVSGNSTVIDLLIEVRKCCLDGFEHQGYPFDRIVDDIRIGRDLSRSPVFDAMLILQNQDDSPPAFDGIQSSFHIGHTGTSKVDITLSCKDVAGEIWVNLEYNTDLFDSERMSRMADHFGNIVGSAVADPSQRIEQLDYLTESEKSLVLDTWNATDLDYPADRTVVDLIDQTACVCADKIAVTDQSGSLTYAELRDASNRLAHRLIEVGVRGQELIGLCVDRSPQMIVALLGILKSGAAYVPLDPHHPPSRLRDIVEDADLTCLVTSSALTDTVAGIASSNTDVLFLDEELEAIERQPADRPTVPISPGNVCYAIYTSGSTGRPKGVVIPHRALVNFLWSMKSEPGLSSEDVLLGVTTLSFDIAALEIFLPLVAGARLIVASHQQAADAEQLGNLIESETVTVLQATPATWSMLIEMGWQGKPDLKILCGGEAMSSALARELINCGAEVWNLYGPTETTIWSTCHQLRANQIEAIDEGAVPIGRPIGNTQIYILDGNMRPVGIGVPGDLYIGGDGLALGYQGRTDLTRERFVAHPFSSDVDSRIYKTGDLARYYPSGDIEFLGRTDYQVKIRGFRIETGDVEAAMLAHTSVQQAVVIAVSGSSGSLLVAYVIGDESQTADLRTFLRQRIPDYMVPSLFHYLERFPLTPSQKVDRKALPDPDPDAATRSHEFVAPRSPTEQTVAAIWQDVLGVTIVGVYDDFFELGGHSLSATRAVFRLQRETDLQVELADLFRFPSIDGLCQTLEGRQIGTGSENDAANMKGKDAPPIDEMTAEELALLQD